MVLQSFGASDPTRSHRGYVRAVASIPGADLIASGGYDGTVRISRSDTLEPIAAADVHRDGVGWIDVSAGGQIASVGVDGRIVFSHVDDRSMLQDAAFELPVTSDIRACEAVRWHRGCALAGTVDGELFEVDPVAGPRRLSGGFVSINSIRAVGDLILLGTDANTVCILRRTSDGAEKILETEALDEHADAIDIRPRGRGLRAAVATHTNVLHYFDDVLSSGPPRKLPVGRLAHNSVVFRDDERLLVGGDDHVLYQVNTSSGRVDALADLGRDIDCVCVAPDRRHALVATTGGIYRVNLEEARIVARSHNRGALSAISAVRGGLVVGFHDAPRAAFIGLNPDAPREIVHADLPAPANCSAPGAAILGCADGSVVQVLPSGETRVLDTSPGEPDALCLAGWGERTWVVGVNRLGQVSVSSPRRADNACCGTACPGRGACGGPGFITRVTPDGSRLKSIVPLPGTPHLLATGKNRDLYRLTPSPGGLASVALRGERVSGRTLNCIGAHDAGTIFVSGWDHAIHRLRVDQSAESYQRDATFRGHEHAVEDLICHADRIVSCSYDGSVRLWDASGRDGAGPIATLHASSLPIRRLAAGHAPGTAFGAGYDGRVTEFRIADLAVLRQWEVLP